MSNIKQPIDLDIEYLFKVARSRLHRYPSESEEDAFIAKCKEFAVTGKTGDFAARHKAFEEVMLKL